MNSQLVKGAAVTGKQFQDLGQAVNQGYMQDRDPNAWLTLSTKQRWSVEITKLKLIAI